LAGRFSIVIVHRNGLETLLRTLDALAAAIDPVRDEIFVTDNGSSDDSLARVRAAHPAVRIIENGCNLGYAAAINQVVPRVESPFLLFLNNDAFVAPGLFDLVTNFNQVIIGIAKTHSSARVKRPLAGARCSDGGICQACHR
jgi:GT2 family glycosyltransferase